MTDPIPDYTNRVACYLGWLFHPAVICVPTLLLVLRDLPPLAALCWTVLVASMVVVPGSITVAILRRQQRYVYQRHTRLPVYVITWLSVVASLAVVALLDGPRVLEVCLAALIVWLPLQAVLTHYYTKISTHVAVAAGCTAGLWLLGHLDGPLLQVAGLGVVGLTAWARVTTRHHTLAQVVLGLVVGTGSVLVVFPLLLG